MKTKEQVIEWLKSRGLYEAFAKNLLNETIDERLKLFEGRYSTMIEASFSWANSNEGCDFWDNANNEFRHWLESDERTEEDEQSSDRWIFDRGSKEAPFYMVYAEGKSAPTYKHGSMEQATKEADRLAKFLNTKTYVLAAVMEIRPEVVTSAVGIDDMEHQVDNPF